MTLRTYIVKRAILSIFVLWLVATFNFIAFSVSRGDPVNYMLSYQMDTETKQMLKVHYGYFDPWHVRYLKYLRNMFTFGVVPPYFGWSTFNKNFVAEGLYWRLGITTFLLGTALTGSIIIGISLGVFAASKRGTKTDVGIMGSALLTWGTPVFFIAILAQFFFTRILYCRYGIKVFSTTWATPNLPVRNLEFWAIALSQLTLPVLIMVLVGFGSWALYSRNMLIDALTQDFVITGRAKGLTKRALLYKYTLKSILPPIATLIALSIPNLVTGSIIVETIFGIEGIGKYFLKAVKVFDITIYIIDPAVAQAVFFIFAALVIVFNLMADIIYGVLDPRIRIGTRR